MALQKAHTNSADVTAASAYHRIIAVHLGPAATHNANVTLAVFKDAAAAAAGKNNIDVVQVTVNYDLASVTNLYAALYAALKLKTSPIDYTVGVTDV